MNGSELTETEEQTSVVALASLFGRFQLRASDGSEIVLSNRRVRALLAMLCLAPDEPIERDYLSKLLWPGRFEAHAKASLRQCLLDLGKLLGPGLVDVTRSRVGLHAAAIRTDLGELEAALRAGDHAGAAEQLALLGAAPLLDQMEFGDAFADWLSQHRAKVEQRLQTAVTECLAALERDGDTALHARLLSSWRQREPTGQGIAIAGRTDSRTPIAILPFRPVGMSDEQLYFADGIADELITALGQVAQLRVAGRTSSFHFRGSQLALPEIAAALKVSHLIEGSVQRQGEAIRIHVHLIDGSTGFESWARRFDGTLDDVFALQEKVAQAVTAAIGAALGIAMLPPQLLGPTRSKAAYDLYLQGQSLCARRFGDGVLDTAIHLFEQALELDPDFAECWVALAEAHQLVSVYTQCLDRNAEAARMAECAHRAIALSPKLGYAYSLLGVYELTRFNFVAALDYGYQAYRLDPNDPAVAMRLAYFLIFIGRTRDAAPYIRAALDQDPVDGRKHALVWGVQFGMGDLEAASSSAQRMVDLGMMSTCLAITSAAQGKHDLAIEQYQLTKQKVNDIILPPVGIGIQTPEAMDAYWLVAAKGICSGREEDRQTYFQVLEMLYGVLHDKSDFAISGPAIVTGNAELVFKTFGHCISPSNLMALVPLWTKVDPICRVWQHPEFIPFAQRIGMAAAWDKYGWPDLLPPPCNRVEPAS
jgi:TolB-like protein